MNFVFPAAFFLTALGAGIVALYLQRQRRRTIEVSTLLFWQRVMEREPHRQFLGRLRHPLSLLVQLLILLAVILALARPEPGRRATGHTMVVIDARARMQAGDGRVFRDAVKAAQDIAARASSESPVGILAVRGGPDLISGFSGDSRDLREKLSALPVTDAAGGMEETLALGRRLLESQPGERRLVVITDRPLETDDAEEILTGRAEDNAAILALSQRPVPSSPQSAEVFVKIGNFAVEASDLELELSLDGRVFDLQKFRVGPGEEKNYSLVVPAEMLRAGPGGLQAKLTQRDGLEVDNSAHALLTTGSPLRVLLLTKDNPFLEGALRADPSVQMEILEPSGWRPEFAESFDAVIFDREFPAGLSLDGGRFFFFGRSPFESPGESVVVSDPEITDAKNPLLWNVKSIGPVKARLLRAPEGWRFEAPLFGEGSPLVLMVEKPGGSRHVATAFGVDDTAFPLRAGFPLFVSNVVRWLAGREHTGTGVLEAGQIFHPAPGEKIALKPRETPTVLAGEAPLLAEAPVRLERKGFYETRGPRETRWVAVNASSGEESDLRKSTNSAGSFLSTPSAGGLLLWQGIALLALGLLLVEWWLHHRRITE